MLYSGLPHTPPDASMLRLPVFALVLLVAAPFAWGQASAPDGREARGSGGSTAPARVEAPAPAAELAVEDAPLYYVTGERPSIHTDPGSRRTIGRLDFREGVHVLAERDGWSRVDRNGRRGWVRTEALSNVWILIDKESRYLYVYRGTELERKLPVDVSQNPDGDKVRRSALGESDHYRIPEGVFFITNKNTQSQYYRSLMLNYPNEEHAERGLREGLISRAEYRQIVSAARSFRSPPMGTRLGGAIAIHGQGSGRQRAWTRGCVALRDVHMDAIWDLVEVGTPVLVQ